jgi:hypothetical protein
MNMKSTWREWSHRALAVAANTQTHDLRNSLVISKDTLADLAVEFNSIILGIEKVSNRIPATELSKIASNLGWNFVSDNSLHLLDLQEAIRQGGSDESLTIWGKLNKWTAETLMRKELLEQIPQAPGKTISFIYLRQGRRQLQFVHLVRHHKTVRPSRVSRPSR